MKKWPWYLGALVLIGVLGWEPFQGTDVARLQPVEVVCVTVEGNTVTVWTDTGDLGQGADPQAAFEDLKQTTAGQVFLETADFILVNEEAAELLPLLGEYLRPACGVCLVADAVDMEKVGDFLDVHSPDVTLQDCRAGEQTLPRLTVNEERMELVS